MFSKDLPPQKPNPVELIKSFIQSEQNADNKQPHVVFLAHDLSRSMKDRLEQQGITFDEFITKTCLDYIRQQERDKLKAQKHMDFSEMQLFEHNTSRISQSRDVSLSNATEESSSEELIKLSDSVYIRKEKK